MNVLVVGGGGREHALAWKLSQSNNVQTVFVAPGNAGTQCEPGLENVPLNPMDFDALVHFATENNVGFTMIGPEAPLVEGVVDYFASHGLRCFGPSANAAQLEGSKAFSKAFLARHGVPTAGYAVFSEPTEAIAYVRMQGAPIVVKADGLAAGKGVIVAETLSQAEQAITDMLSGNAFGDAGARVVIEEFLEGEEASFIVVSDGEHVVPMATSQDHKRIGEGDTGLNTGGMGAYSPAPVVTSEAYKRIMKDVIEPTIRGMREDGHPYVGFLYAGLMIDKSGQPKVIEFNCRFGDPETQPIMLRLRGDFLALCQAALDAELSSMSVDWDPRPALGVVMASGGYPGSYDKGHVIHGLKTDKGDPDPGNPGKSEVKVFHAGTASHDGHTVTSGGRVLCVAALGSDLRDAKDRAYARAKEISWQDAVFRHDIGWRALDR